MKRVLLKISYDGTDYHGWQVQPNGITIQEILQNSISKVLNSNTRITGCSRTDAGVHAREFYCHLDCDESIPKDAFLRGVNSVLPKDIAIIDVIDVENTFHARYSCKGKNYLYNFYFGTTNPFMERYALRLDSKPDFNLMNEFCKGIVGTHDFEGFSSSKRTVEDTVRTITNCEIINNDNGFSFSVSADGFLYNMVRILAGTCLWVGYGKLPADIYIDIFGSKDRSLGGNTLSPKGLFLDKVFYDLE